MPARGNPLPTCASRSSASIWHCVAFRRDCPLGPVTHSPSGPHVLKTYLCFTAWGGGKWGNCRYTAGLCMTAPGTWSSTRSSVHPHGGVHAHTALPRSAMPPRALLLPFWYQGRNQGQETLTVVLGSASGQQENLSKVRLQTSSVGRQNGDAL